MRANDELIDLLLSTVIKSKNFSGLCSEIRRLYFEQIINEVERFRLENLIFDNFGHKRYLNSKHYPYFYKAGRKLPRIIFLIKILLKLWRQSQSQN